MSSCGSTAAISFSTKRPRGGDSQPRQCPVCCDTFTLAARRPVTCSNCDYIACVACNKAFLLSVEQDPHCMNCKHPWNREFLDAFPKTWINGEVGRRCIASAVFWIFLLKMCMSVQYAKHREKVLMDRELSRLPDSQHLVQNFQIAKSLQKQLLEEQNEKIRLRRRLVEIEGNKWNVQNRLQRIKQSHYNIDGIRLEASGEGGHNSTRKAFVCRCPAEECRGFLSSQYKCGTCNLYACPDCQEIIGESKTAPHECNPQTVETVRMLKKDSKPCPSCGTTIFKIDGCDQVRSRGAFYFLRRLL